MVVHTVYITLEFTVCLFLKRRINNKWNELYIISPQNTPACLGSPSASVLQKQNSQTGVKIYNDM